MHPLCSLPHLEDNLILYFWKVEDQNFLSHIEAIQTSLNQEVMAHQVLGVGTSLIVSWQTEVMEQKLEYMEL